MGVPHEYDSLPAFGKAQRHDNNGGGIIISQLDEATGANAPIRDASGAWPKSCPGMDGVLVVVTKSAGLSKKAATMQPA